MPRLAPIITLDELKEKLKPILGNEEFPYEMPEKLTKDISKVEFDFENYEYEGNGFMNYPCGFRVLPNGLPVLFVNAGGDWEVPICFIIYWDGKSVRGYIPTKGNLFNQKEMCAYGSELNPDDDFDYEKLKSNEGEIIEDIMNRIQITNK